MQLKGSFTIEASIVISIAMLIITTFIYTGIMLRDQVVLVATGLYYVNVMNPDNLILAENDFTENEKISLMEKFLGEAEHQTLVMHIKDANLQAEKQKSEISFTADANSYGNRETERFLERLLCVDKHFEREQKMEAAEFVRMCRGMIWR